MVAGKRAAAPPQIAEKSEKAPVSKKPRRIESEFLRTLLNTRVEQLRQPDNKIFIAQRDDNLSAVFQGLTNRDFLSVPVLQKTGQKYYGFVDVADIVQFIVDHFGESKLRGEEDFWKNVALEEEFQKATVRDVMRYPLTLRNPFHPIKVGFSLLSAIELLAKEENLHRIPVVDDQRQLKGLVTQSHVIRFINQHINEVGSKKDKPVGEVEGVLKPVVCASVKDEALSAFQKMIRTNVSGIAVIDDSGRIVNNLSLRDLKAIAPDARLFWRLYQTLDAFMRRLKEDYEKKHNRPHSPQTVTVNDTLETVVKKAAEHRIHRVFIINDQRQPIGVISLKDVLREFITDI